MLRRWPGYAAALWGFLFAVPSIYWALGGMAGLTSQVAPALVELAEDRVPWFIAVLWITGALKALGALMGLALTRPWGRPTRLALLTCGWGAAVLLVWHGAGFVVGGASVQLGLVAVDPGFSAVIRWYTYLWGPWFIAGGLAFAAASWTHLRHAPDRAGKVASAIGGLGAAAVSIAPVALGIG